MFIEALNNNYTILKGHRNKPYSETFFVNARLNPIYTTILH